MKRAILLGMCAVAFGFGATGTAFGAIIDFAGGTATLGDASTVVTNNTSPYLNNVDYYVESGFRVDFIGALGIIGNYYGAPVFGHPEIQNSVIHAHWGALTAIRFSKTDNSPFDLNYLDLSSNTAVGGGADLGTELTQVTTSGGYSMTLPTSDWGITHLSDGTTLGDGVVRMWPDSNFDNITSFTVTSQNAYCFGLDNFYIDETPPAVPVPGSLLLTGIGIAGVARWRRRSGRA